MGDLAGRAAVGHGDGDRARQEMQSTDARKSTTVVYDSFIQAQVKAEEGCNVAPTPTEVSYTTVVGFLASVPCISSTRFTIFTFFCLCSPCGEESPASTLYSTFVFHC
ncbi:hypothetical protein R1flu_011013 [Riccia fluitans]|uniref:Uncharacterized protein n=1 Tax=Riccia fluitans TaxID=41844 RepID=A0ABD1Z6Z1_9MARC